ncbi:MAG: hypothetical protein OEW64_02035 [Gammaproteobacteria bacterium]|nr:hypothetical protein [Gammaproteobacteria bacterium]MDH5302859.1 hypothetical protein [Gammaproteobacteria bacterium]MDH5323016.1 hypothetical protein [Gammaproteobacteria bacterium]
MRSCLQIVWLALVLQGVPALAIESGERDLADRADTVYDDGFFPGIVCNACRDPWEYPEDYAALIYNGFFGDEPWLTGWRLGLPIRVYDENLNYVLVWFEGVLFDAPSLLPNLMDILVRLPNGVIIKLTVLQEGPDMIVGEEPDRVSSGTTACYCGSGAAGNEDDDYEEPEEFEEIEFDDPVGIVDIVDPDEDGEFPEWEEEL